VAPQMLNKAGNTVEASDLMVSAACNVSVLEQKMSLKTNGVKIVKV